MEAKNKSYTCNNGGNWNISKSLRKYLSNIPVKREIKEIQKTALLGSAHILRELLMLEYKTLAMGERTALPVYCNYIIAETLIAWFVSGI